MALAPLVDRSSELALPFPLAKQVVSYDRISPFVAGSMTGLLGGGAMVALTDALMSLPHYNLGSHAFLHLLASPLVRFLPSPWLIPTGVAYLVVGCSILSGAFSSLTQRLHKIVPLMFWTALSFGAIWILADAAIVSRLPDLAAKLPFLPVLAGAGALAVVACFQLPLRRDRGVVEVRQAEEPDDLSRDSFV